MLEHLPYLDLCSSDETAENTYKRKENKFYAFRCRQINHARNIWDRAVTVLPRANQFWYKYTYMEEMLGNIAGIMFHPSILVCHKLTLPIS